MTGSAWSFFHRCFPLLCINQSVCLLLVWMFETPLNALWIKVTWLIGLFVSAEVSSRWRASTWCWSRLLAALTGPTGSTRLNTSTSLPAPAATASTSHLLLPPTGLRRAAAPSGASAPGWESLLMMSHPPRSRLASPTVPWVECCVAGVWFCGADAQSNQDFYHTFFFTKGIKGN